MNRAATAHPLPGRELEALLERAADGAGYKRAYAAGEGVGVLPDVIRDSVDGSLFVGSVEDAPPSTDSAARARLRAQLSYVHALLQAGTVPDASFALATRDSDTARLWSRVLNAMASDVGLSSSCFAVKPLAHAWMAVATWM